MIERITVPFRWHILLFCIYIAAVQSINIDFDDSKDGFFLKSPYHKFKPSEPSVVKESLILTHPAEVHKLRASYGPFEQYQVVPSEFLTNVQSYGDSLDTSVVGMHRQVVHNMDISAHLIKQQITESNPVVQVLIHAQPLTRRQQQDLLYSYYGYSQWWCAQIFVTKGAEELTAVCLLNGKSNACVAGLHFPDSWWQPFNSSQLSQDVRVYYDISHVRQNQECASVSNTIIPSRAEPRKPASERKFISTVELVHEQKTYNVHKDQDLIFQIPELELHANSRFEVRVLLEKDSNLKEVVIKVKVRGPLIIEGATSPTTSSWSVHFEPGDKEGTATVTAFMKEDAKDTKSYKQEEVMRWQFRVAKDHGVLLMSTACVVWTVNYDKNGLPGNPFYSPEENKIAAKFNIYESQTETIIPVLKERVMLNSAVLTGKMEKYDLNVYSVMNDNSFHQLAKNISCQTTDPEALKVSVSCEHVYLDGSEIRGAKNVTIVVRTADHMAQFSVRVWIPEPRLDIQFSDSKLSQVKGWKVKRAAVSSRKKRAIDLGLLTHSNVIMGTDDQNLPYHQSCRYKYQQARVEVYARFGIHVPGEAPRYYRNKKTYVRVTDLVKNRLQTANRNVAKIVGSTVLGVSSGKTDVQVVSPTGKLMGAKEIRVGKDKVEIERLMVRVISGMGLHITEDRNLPGALMATVYLRDHLVARQQEAVLDIALEFKDGTTLPLTNVDPAQFSLKVTSVNPNVVEVVESESTTISPSLPPTIKAVGNGKGDIVKVVLTEANGCHRRKPRTLDTEYVHVMVDFAKGDYYGQAQRDGNYYSNQPNKGMYAKETYANKEEYFKHLEELSIKQQQMGRNKDVKSTHKVYDLKDTYDKESSEMESVVDKDTNTSEPDREAVGKPVSTKAQGLSPLEIGMYVLVGVFIFAIFVFTANCAVFMVRYRRKRRGHKKSSHVVKGSISQAQDWVWIGRDTLERNGARNTGCNQPLMAEEDFNGNQMVIPNTVTRSSKQCSNRDSTVSEGSSSSGIPSSGSSGGGSSSNRNSMTSTYQGSECSIRITSNPLPDNDSGMGYNEAEWDYEAMGMTYEQLMEYFDNLKESCA